MIPSLKFYEAVSSVNCDWILHDMKGTNDGLLKLGLATLLQTQLKTMDLTNKISIHCNFHRWFICCCVVSE